MVASLDSIVAATRQRLAQGGTAERRGSRLRELELKAEEHVPRGFRSQLRRVSRDGIAVIAELKKASPSKGLIRRDFRPLELALELEQAGASALSVLTDEQFFQGSLEYLRQASSKTSIPCLRKDFIVDEFQILETRANRADAILLIVAALEQKELIRFAEVARSHGLDVLCEVHDEQELRRSLDAGCDLIGVNNRNLHTFEVNLETAFRIVEKIPAECVRVAESGIQSGSDLARLHAAGYNAFLIGESLMKAEHPGKALSQLVEEAKQASIAGR
jgi:indole-3-glycerol phosphate synthase